MSNTPQESQELSASQASQESQASQASQEQRAIHELEEVQAEQGLAPLSAVPPAHASDEEQSLVLDAPPMNMGKTLTYSSGNFGAGIFFGFNNFILPLYLKSFGAPDALIGLLASTRSLEGSVIQPTVGAISDRIWTRLGRRKPFFLIFVPLCVAFLILTPFLAPPQNPPLGESSEWSLLLILAAVGIFLFSVTFNIMYDPYNSLLADITPQRQRGWVNGVFQAAAGFGEVAILLVGAVVLEVDSGAMRILFLITALTLLASFLPPVLGIREPRKLPGVATHRRYRVRDYWDGLKSDRQVLFYFATQFFIWFGIDAIAPFLTLYAINVTGLSPANALLLPLVALLSTAIGLWPLGALGDRLGLRRVLMVGLICMAIACSVAIVARTPLPLFILMAFVGFGNAAQIAVSFPMLTRIVFPDQIGLYTGLNTAVQSVAAPVSAFIAGELIDLVGYPSLFPFVAAMFVIAIAPLALLRIEKSRAARERAKQESRQQ